MTDREHDDGLTDEERAALEEGDEDTGAGLDTDADEAKDEDAKGEADDDKGDEGKDDGKTDDAGGRDDGDAAPAAEVKEPASAPLLVVDTPTDADDRLKTIATQKEDLITKYDDGEITATTPAHAAGSVNVTVTAPGGTSSPATYTYADVPVAGAASHTAAYGGAATAVTLNISGTYTSVEVVTQPTKGAAVVNGLGIDYTPTAGQVGSDSFTYRASNASGTSNTATVSVTVNAPTIVLAPAAGALPAATVGTVCKLA